MLQPATLQSSMNMQQGSPQDLQQVAWQLNHGYASHVAWVTTSMLPSTLPGSRKEDLFATGNLSADSQTPTLSLTALEMSLHLDQAHFDSLQIAPFFVTRHPGRITALQVFTRGARQHIITASASGSLSMLTLQVPPDSGVRGIQAPHKATELDAELDSLRAWQQPHSSSIAALDVTAGGHVLTAGSDGALKLMDMAQPGAWTTHIELGSTVSFRAACWLTDDTFCTASTSGGLQMWDVRQRGKAAGRSPLAWGLDGTGAKGSVGRQIHSVAGQRGRPELCASGGSDGVVQLWDVRFAERPLQCAAAGGEAAEVWQVRFDPISRADDVLACTSAGTLFSTSAPGEAADDAAVTALISQQAQHSSIEGFDVGKLGSESEIVAISDAGTATLLHRYT